MPNVFLDERDYASPYYVGETSNTIIPLQQEMIGTFPDGQWKECDEIAWVEMVERDQWALVRKIWRQHELPKFIEVV